jgi:hypothetical protein
MNTITCNKCGNVIEINQALDEQARRSIEDKIREESQRKFEQLQKDAEEKIAKRFSEKFEYESKQYQEEIAENRKQNKELKDELLQVMKNLRDANKEKENTEIEMQKKLAFETEKIHNDVKNKSDEEHKLKMAEMQKQLTDARKSNEEMARKLDQRSQQLQGEVLELDLEKTLRDTYIFDSIEPIGKGIHGADIRQIVKTQRGNVCGIILWEVKQQKSWKKDFIEKLKIDMRDAKANIPIIVSTQLPESARNGFGFIDGVYVVSPSLAVSIAEAMRQQLIDIARERFVTQNKEDKAEDLYVYVTSQEFRQHLEALAEVYHAMKIQIDKERGAFQTMWETREKQLTKLNMSTARMVGGMRGIIGQSLAPIKNLELAEGDNGNE